MANYTDLKAAIANAIKYNDNHEITGEILQEQLLAIISSLGAGYQFVSVATTETEPGTPDANVMYIAGAGTYPNFGATEVPQGSFGVFRYNGSWDYSVLDVASWADASNKLYYNTQAGNVAAKTIQADGFTLQPGGWIKIHFNNANEAENPTLNVNNTGAHAMTFNGELVSETNSWKTGETVAFYYDNYGVGIWQGIRLVEYLDFINVNELINDNTEFGSVALARAAVPLNYRKYGLQITYFLADGWYTDQFIGDDTSDWGDADNWKVLGTPMASVEENSMAFKGENTLDIDGKFIYQDGTINSNPGWKISPYIPVKEGDKFLLNVGGGNVNTRPIGYYDSSKNVVSVVNYNDTTNYIYNGVVTIPSGVSFVVFCNNSASYTTPTIYKFSVVDYEYYNSFSSIENMNLLLFDLDYTKFFIQKNKFIFAAGNIGESNGYNLSDYIPVSEGDKLLIQVGGGNNAIRLIALCNSSKVVTSVVSYTDWNTHKYEGIFVVPANVSYILVGNNDNANGYKNPSVKRIGIYESNLIDELNNVNEESKQLKTANIILSKRVDNVTSIDDNHSGASFTLEDCELYADNAFINNSGEIQSYQGAKCFRFTFLTNEYIGVTVQFSGTSPNGFLEYDDGTKVLLNNTYILSNYGIVKAEGKKYKYLYLNAFYNDEEQTAGVTEFKLFSPQRSYLANDGKEYLDCSNIVYRNKYINDSGQLIDLNGYLVVRIDYDHRFDYFRNGSLQLVGGVYNADNEYIGAVKDYIIPWSSGAPGKSLFPIGTTYFLVTLSPMNFWWRTPKREEYRRIHQYLQKPFVFSGKSAIFFGDSITDGFVSVPGGSQYYDRNKAWPKLLCDRLNMTCNNQGIGGSALTEYGSQYTSGVKLICGPDGTRVDITEDYIFIAHGTNDWTSNIPIGKVTDMPEDWEHATTFFGALNLIAQKIKTDYSTKIVIFVLPIWRAQYGDFKYSLNTYREAICDVAFRNNFNVIDGSEFGFECGSNLLIADKTHPTELGYVVYTNQMYDRLI